MNKITETEARKRRKAYRDTHTVCLCLLPHPKGLALCLEPNPSVHHIAGGRLLDEYERLENYYSLTGRPGHDHHLGWAHGQDGRFEMSQQEARLWCFAWKYAVGETDPDQAEALMRGRGLTWWEPGMGASWTLQDEIRKRARILMARITNLHLMKKHLTRG